MDYSQVDLSSQPTTWQESFHVSAESKKPIKRFDDFKSVDWLNETLKENKAYYRFLSESGSEMTQRSRPESRRSIGDTNSTDSATPNNDSSSSLSRNTLEAFLEKTSNFNTLIGRFIAAGETWIALILIGIIVGLIAGIMDVVVSFLASLKSGRCTTDFYLNKAFCCWGEGEETCATWQPWSEHWILKYLIFIAFSATFGYIAAILCKNYAPTATGSGISEVKCNASGFTLKGFLGWWTLLIKSIALPLTIASGLSVGKEGPSVHYAACAGNVIPKLFKGLQNSFINRSQFLIAASAAGVAVAFGSPIGGVLFSIEEISNNFRLSTLWKSYFCSLVATATLAAFNPFRTGQIVLFEVKYDNDWNFLEIPFFIILGMFGGIYGILVSKYNIRVVQFRQKYLANHAVREVVILCIISSMVGYFNDFMKVDMTEAMDTLFRECGSAPSEIDLCGSNVSGLKLFTSLIIATLLRMIFVIISYGCKVPCGIFVPSMAAGATFGRAVGLFAEHVFKSSASVNIIPGSYAFLGAAAALSGITHLMVTVVLIMFELTGAIKYMIPTMIVVAVTKSINDKWGHGGIADQMIVVNGMPFIDPKEEHDFHDHRVADAMTDTVVAISNQGLKLTDLEVLLSDTKFKSFPLIKSQEDPIVIGYLNREDILKILDLLKTNKKTEDYEIQFLSQRKLIKLVGKQNIADDHSQGIDITETQHFDNSLGLDKFIRFEYLTYTPSSTLEPIYDMFLKIGARFVIVEEEGNLVGILTRKDIIKYEIYLHNQHGGGSSIYKTDGELEAKIWSYFCLVGDSINKNITKYKNKLLKKSGLDRYIPLSIDDEVDQEFEIR